MEQCGGSGAASGLSAAELSAGQLLGLGMSKSQR